MALDGEQAKQRVNEWQSFVVRVVRDPICEAASKYDGKENSRKYYAKRNTEDVRCRDFFAAKEILGHHRIQTTMIYAHAQREHVRQIHMQRYVIPGV